MSVACYCGNRSVIYFTGSKSKPCVFWTSLLGAFQVSTSLRFQKLLIKRGEFHSCHFFCESTVCLGAVGLTVGYPLDTVKVRLQTQSVYQGLFHCVSETYTHEGVSAVADTKIPEDSMQKVLMLDYLLSYQLHGFFKGMAFPLLSTGLITSIAFGSYSTALDLLTGSRHSDPSQRKTASAAQVFTAGSFAGLTQVRRPDVYWLVLPRLDHRCTTRQQLL